MRIKEVKSVPVKLPKKRHDPVKLREKPPLKRKIEKKSNKSQPVAKKKRFDKKIIKKGPKFGNDIDQNCTIFIRNVPFDVSEDELKEFFSQFDGVTVVMAVLVRDKDSKLPKGTAFVKFSNLFEAETIVKEAQDPFKQTKFNLKGRQLVISLAIAREEAQKIATVSKTPDTSLSGRNLHLARVGMIRPNSKEAESISKRDMQMREQLLVQKEQKLRDPYIFVSPNRLCIRNLPKSVDDSELKKIILANIDNKRAWITECRVMKNLQENDRSLGYAFVNFTQHKDALETLNKFNNNSTIFESKVPIVEFSLENQRALDKKQRRQQNNEQDKNQLFKVMKKKKAVKGLLGTSTRILPKKLKNAKKRHSYRGPASI
ncbi:RNA-binding protein 28, partial [Cichlidogyrus casuarinus]